MEQGVTGPTHVMTATRDETKGQPVGRGGRRVGLRPKEEGGQRRVDGGGKRGQAGTEVM